MDWRLLPFWSYRLDPLGGLFAAACCLALLGSGGGPANSRRYLGALLLLLGILQTAFAAESWGRWAGLELATLGLLAQGIRGALPRHLAGYPLLLAALSGVLDNTTPPGITPPTLPAWAVLAVALTALSRAGCWPFGAGDGPHPQPLSQGERGAGPANTRRPPVSGPDSPLPLGEGLGVRSVAPALRTPQLALGICAAAGLYVLLRTLESGPWDAWTRLALLVVGLLTLARAVWAGLGAVGAAVQAHVWRFALAVVLLGLGVGTPSAVGGATALLILAPLGLLLLTRHAAGLRLIGALALLGLPPLASFAGLWLIAAGALLASYLLVVVAVPLGALLLGCVVVNARGAPDDGSRFDPLGLLGAAILVLGGLAGEPALNKLLRPALNELAAGVPALRELQSVPGIGLIAGTTQFTAALWPATAMAVCLGVALALAYFVRQLANRLAPATSAPETMPEPQPLIPTIADAPAFPDLAALLRLIATRRA